MKSPSFLTVHRWRRIGHFKTMDRKIDRFEALAAVDRMSSRVLGIIGLSRTANRISWFGVRRDARRKGIGKRLLDTALRHLDNTKDRTVVTFTADNAAGQPARALYQSAGFRDIGELTDENCNRRCRMRILPSDEKRGVSFHYQYPDYGKYTDVEYCLCCNEAPTPDSLVDIAQLAHSVATAERHAQGRLFGKCHVMMKEHYIDFEQIPVAVMAGFMADVQLVGKALHQVTGAVKVNYEIHSNSAPHIHCHLFPRYLDDDFPSAPIDYRIYEPSPYESEEEFSWFVERMRERLVAR